MRQGLVLALMLLTAGCATKVYIGPGTGVSAESQLVLSRTLQDALNKLNLGSFAKKRVLLRIFGSSQTVGIAPSHTLIWSLLAERLAKSGATLVNKNPDVLLYLSVAICGVDVVRRDLIPFYHHTNFRATVDLRLAAYDPHTMALIDKVQHTRASWCYREKYWLYIIGPYRSLWKEE